MEIHKGLTAGELEAQYNLRALRPDLDSRVFPDWLERSTALRESAEAQLDLAYGPGERDKLDFFSAGKTGGTMSWISM